MQGKPGGTPDPTAQSRLRPPPLHRTQPLPAAELTPQLPPTASATATPVMKVQLPVRQLDAEWDYDDVTHQRDALLTRDEARAIANEVSQQAVQSLRSEYGELIARIRLIEDRLRGLSQPPPARTSERPPPAPYAAPVAASAQVAPVIAVSSIAQAGILPPAQPAPAASPLGPMAIVSPLASPPVASAPIAPPRQGVQFDTTPDLSDMAFMDGGRRQRRVRILVLMVLLIGVGTAIIVTIASQI